MLLPLPDTVAGEASSLALISPKASNTNADPTSEHLDTSHVRRPASSTTKNVNGVRRFCSAIRLPQSRQCPYGPSPASHHQPPTLDMLVRWHPAASEGLRQHAGQLDLTCTRLVALRTDCSLQARCSWLPGRARQSLQSDQGTQMLGTTVDKTGELGPGCYVLQGTYVSP